MVMRNSLPHPSFEETFGALGVVGTTLDRDVAYLHDSTYYFPLGEDWSVTLTPESAGRFRLDLAHGREVRTSIWSSAKDRARIEGSALEMAGLVATLV